MLTILQYPDPRLHTVARAVDFSIVSATARMADLTRDLFEAMYDANGIGLAATQVNVHERVIVIDVSEARNEPRVLINPELIAVSAERQKAEEGCLSVPGIYDGVERALSVRVRAMDVNGKAQEFDADGLLAVCVQHEMDHLQGKVFVEYLSPLKRNRIKTKLQKAQREAARG